VGTSNNLYGIAWFNSTWVAVGSLGSIFTSTNGITWVPATTGSGATSNDLRGVAGSGSTAVAVGLSGTVLTSSDGVNWTLQSPTGSADLYAVNVSSDQILAIGANGNAYTTPVALTSPPIWTTVTSSTQTSSNLTGVSGSSALYYVVGAGGVSIWSN
jgi:hypothetical protein